jgi:hypothetical protein
VSRHRDRHRERPKRTWVQRLHDRYPDPGLAETGIDGAAASFIASWGWRRWRDRRDGRGRK